MSHVFARWQPPNILAFLHSRFSTELFSNNNVESQRLERFAATSQPEQSGPSTSWLHGRRTQHANSTRELDASPHTNQNRVVAPNQWSQARVAWVERFNSFAGTAQNVQPTNIMYRTSLAWALVTLVPLYQSQAAIFRFRPVS